MKPIRTGVVGVGYLGKFHAEKYSGTVKRKRCKKCRNEILVRQVNNNSGGGFSAGV